MHSVFQYFNILYVLVIGTYSVCISYAFVIHLVCTGMYGYVHPFIHMWQISLNTVSYFVEQIIYGIFTVHLRYIHHTWHTSCWLLPASCGCCWQRNTGGQEVNRAAHAVLNAMADHWCVRGSSSWKFIYVLHSESHIRKFRHVQQVIAGDSRRPTLAPDMTNISTSILSDAYDHNSSRLPLGLLQITIII